MPKLLRLFIVIESTDAAGGSTQAGLLTDRLMKASYEVLPLHFPQEEKATGQLIYGKFLRDRNRPKLTRREQALLYIQDFFSRAEDIRKFISPSGLSAEALAKADEGKIKRHARRTGGGWKRAVICDRFYHSTLAYQTAGLDGERRRRMIAWIKQLCELNEPRLPKPDQIIFLDTPIAISAQHLRRRTADFFESERKQIAIRRSYQRLARVEGWTVINGADSSGRQRPIADIHDDIWRRLLRRRLVAA